MYVKRHACLSKSKAQIKKKKRYGNKLTLLSQTQSEYWICPCQMQVSRRTAQKQTETYDLIKRNEQCPFDLRLTQAKEKSPEFHASY